MMMAKVSFRRENVMASILFSILSWGLLYSWVYLMRATNERVDSTLPESSVIQVSIILAVIFFVFQKRPGVLKNLFIIISGLILIFLYTITVLHLLLNVVPDIDDFVFYYECFLLMFFCGLPMYLCLRMI
ncbi:transporter [Enterobacter cloacae complex sp. FDA-CDC-AR_0132]|nr:MULTISPECIES: transporter [Enterobacter cloacae complex]AVP01381.1 transporter [Enterobacter cloacae complex sp. FDA-CDC-AR_0132]QIN42027.1 transporter [Enterobacter ludwigii]